MTQKRLAFEAGIDARTLRKIENDIAVSPESYRSVCRVLNLDPGKLTSESGAVAGQMSPSPLVRQSKPFPPLFTGGFAILALIAFYFPHLLLPLSFMAFGVAASFIVVWDAPSRRPSDGKYAGFTLLGFGVWLLVGQGIDFGNTQVPLARMPFLLIFFGALLLVPSLGSRLLPFKTNAKVAYRRLFGALLSGYLFVFWLNVATVPLHTWRYVSFISQHSLLPTWWTLFVSTGNMCLTVVGAFMIVANIRQKLAALLLLINFVSVNIVYIGDAIARSLSALQWVQGVQYQLVDLMMMAAAVSMLWGEIGSSGRRLCPQVGKVQHALARLSFLGAGTPRKLLQLGGTSLLVLCSAAFIAAPPLMLERVGYAAASASAISASVGIMMMVGAMLQMKVIISAGPDAQSNSSTL